MPETKLDQSLDEIVSTQRQSGGRSSGRTRGRGNRATQASRNASSGGIKKSVKPGRAAAATIPTGPSNTGLGDSIQVTNLPKDVSEAQIKEYFNKSVGIVKRVEISYGPGGLSRGAATIVFRDSKGPKKAVHMLNGILVDGRPIKVDMILGARQAATLVPKGLGDRISTPKNKPKTVGGKKNEPTRGSNATRGRGGGKGRTPRPAKKTAEELDSEMADYFEQGVSTTGVATNGAMNGDAMEDEIL